jgi:cytosine/adenosine deaminase-related metal-dependent hydrolase
LGNGLHIHLAQSPDEVEKVERMWGVRPVEWLRDLGLLDERLFAAHLTYIDLERDIPILAEARDFTYVHCPSALGAGGTNAIQPYPELLAAGLNIAIGVDTHSNDIVENLKLAVIDGRARCYLMAESSEMPLQLPTPLDAVRSATDRAANGLGRADLGRIEAGAKADFCTIDVSGLLVGVGALPPDPLNHLLYANGLSVRHVATDGRFQIFDGHLVVGDEEQVIRRGGAVAEKLWKTLAAEGYFEGEPSYPPQWPHSWRASNVVDSDAAALKEVLK